MIGATPSINKFLVAVLLLNMSNGFAQQTLWTAVADSISNLSSPRAVDLNNDGVKDIVFGGASDAQSSHNGIVALDGNNGQLLWRAPARNEVFGSAIFRDITGDNIPDVFIAGRQAQLLALNGSNGQLLWDFFPYQTNPADSGWYNFYNPQFIPDQNNDGTPDLLVANGGDHSAPVWDTIRPAGKLLIIDALNGSILSEATVPDSAEIYCSPVVLDLQNTGMLWVLYGTGGETLGGHFYACQLSHLSAGSLAQSVVLASNADVGFIAPASFCDAANGDKRVFIQGFNGTIYCIEGSTLSTLWTYTKPNTESSSAVVIGNFTGNLEPDAFAVLYKGSGTTYTDYYQVMLDGANGNVVFTDSIGSLHFASANACDFDNNGRDEVLITVNENNGGVFRNKLYTLDFAQQQIQQTGPSVSGVNIASTPLITDLDGDNALELINITRRDSLNPSGIKGVYVTALQLGMQIPNSGIAWGSYMGTKFEGSYQYRPSNCGTGSISSSAQILAPSCNGLSDGSIIPVISSTAAPFTYLWSNGSTASSLTGISAGNYTLRITNALNCYEDISYVLPDPYIITFGGIVPPTCQGDSNGTAVLNSTGCVCQFNTCTFLWSNGVTTKVNTSLPEGWNYVTINHPGGCVVFDSVFVPSPAPVTETVIIQSPSCAGDTNAVIEIQGNSAYPPHTITWWNGTQGNTINNLSAGTYTATIQDGRGCIDSLELQVTEPAPLSVQATAQNLLCFSGIDGEINLSISGGTPPYQASVNGIPGNTTNDSLPTGNYTVLISDSAGCTVDTAGVTISSPDPLTISYSIFPEQNPGSFSGIATAHVQGGTAPYTFLWNDPNQQTDSTATYLATGWYGLLVTDANGCTISDSVFVPILLGVQETENQLMELYPNPASELVYLNILAGDVRVYNVSGQLVIQQLKSKVIDVSGLSEGLYFVELLSEGKIYRQPLVKTGK